MEDSVVAFLSLFTFDTVDVLDLGDLQLVLLLVSRLDQDVEGEPDSRNKTRLGQMPLARISCDLIR